MNKNIYNKNRYQILIANKYIFLIKIINNELILIIKKIYWIIILIH